MVVLWRWDMNEILIPTLKIVSYDVEMYWPECTFKIIFQAVIKKRQVINAFKTSKYRKRLQTPVSKQCGWAKEPINLEAYRYNKGLTVH